MPQARNKDFLSHEKVKHSEQTLHQFFYLLAAQQIKFNLKVKSVDKSDFRIKDQ